MAKCPPQIRVALSSPAPAAVRKASRCAAEYQKVACGDAWLRKCSTKVLPAVLGIWTRQSGLPPDSSDSNSVTDKRGEAIGPFLDAG